MPLISWDDRLVMGLPEIDRQHHKLINLINQLDEQTKAGKGKDAIGERYFDQFGYADAEEHKQEHAALAEKVGNFAAELNSADESRVQAVLAELINFLSIWWKYHILDTDMKYARLFREKGVK